MTNSRQFRLLGARDHEILAALDLTPMTARQLVRLSSTWPKPYRRARTIRERLQHLAEVGLVRTYRYATLHPGQPENYYVLSRAGLQFLDGPDEVPRSKARVGEVSIPRQVHTRALADFLVHTMVAAHNSAIQIAHICPENSLPLTAGSETVYPDLAFSLITAEGLSLRYYVEIDCGTERLRSRLSSRTWQRKARVYDRVADAGNRFRVLVVTVRAGHERLRHIIATAAAEQRNRQRTLLYGITLDDYLASESAVTDGVFQDHHGRPQALVPDMKKFARPIARPLDLRVSAFV